VYNYTNIRSTYPLYH